MKTSWRALVAVALLAGFPVLVFLVVGGLAAAEYFFFQHSGILAIKLGIVAVPMSYALLKALFAIERTRGATTPGVPATRAGEPALWALVEELATAVGTRPPDTITLVSEVNAGVRERTGWLGLRVRRREMFIGAQLLAGLRHDQLCALLGHELGHYSNRDTRLAALTYRGRRSIERALLGLSGDGWFEGLVRKLFVLYAKLYFAVSAAVCRRQELAADAAAARVAGTAAMIGALREIETLDVAWDFYFDRYVAIGWDAGYLPDRLAGGFQALLADEKRAGEFDRVRHDPPAGEGSRYDTHPPTPARIAALEALPEFPGRPGGGHPASEILRDAAPTLEAAVASDFSEKAKAKRRTDWDRLVDLGVRHSVTVEAARILGAGKTLAQALDLIDAGRAAELADPELAPPASAGPRARREFAAASVRARLSTVVQAYLAEAEVAHWKLSWSGPPEFVVDEPLGSGLTTALDAAAAADHDTAPLRRLLAAADVLPVRS
ncbi:Zn-dependent protease with chaperone function [Amycolatopsis mediterranei S699]|uniref:Zn-dependent protease with chaperone function n=3 Tax=Amycolatopsis mediterranei TaxID=33910 RepID=A0A0H3DIR0_AMYMU|nr:M48 family metallopeptidase [Amycolatopsis mediterranei]ADJ50571.1 Zn-dependent protease with chaperone function [Amycolatopsis mediterranei U32]AEK47577.1 Zn-dependent protease with chaperone function [Amycolatopsis mediterranei S699]AFO82277.1 Zn-dependent protease with chaperone function [Amycolatopsis mediterranei S699]AGT89406.1 Zn-dependent protease with chaperone function [Amycolatopsis mediterranei RB]KDO09245.1 Zn-dependent protease [Amycolatopsis mediterranei]